MAQQVDAWTWVLAFLPLALLLFVMIARRWGAAEAGAVGWLTAVVVAIFVFDMSLRAVGLQSVKGTTDALTILYVVWPAILIYEVTREAGAFEPFRRGITRLLPHPLIQVMAFGWVFASFLQGITGFGVPIAVCAPLLVGIGVRPLYAVVIPLVGHAWNNTFGTLAVAWLGLEQVTGMAPQLASATALYAAAFIWVLNLMGGLLVCWLYGKARGLREGLPAVVAISLVHGGTTMLLSQSNPTLAGFTAGLLGFALIFALGRLPGYRQPSAVRDSRIFSPAGPAAAPAPAPAASPSAGSAGSVSTGGTGRLPSQPEPVGPAATMSVNTAFIPYYALLVITFVVLLIAPIKDALDGVSIGLAFPALTTGLGFATSPESIEISLFTHAGTFLFTAALLGYIAYARLGHIGKGGWSRVWSRTLDKAIASTVAVVALVAMATVMQGAGQADALAQGVAAATGPLYAFLAPFVGVLGAFMTSSNLASNLLFGAFQESTAQATGTSTAAILGAQTAGGAIGNTVAPGNVLLGTTTAGILGQEGQVLRITFPLGLLIAAVVGLAVLVVA